MDLNLRGRRALTTDMKGQGGLLKRTLLFFMGLPTTTLEGRFFLAGVVALGFLSSATDRNYVLLVLALLGAPLFGIILASAFAGFMRGDVDPMVVAMEVYRIADTPVLLAIPLFTFAGYLVGESNAPRRLVRVTNAVFGWMPISTAARAIAGRVLTSTVRPRRRTTRSVAGGAP